MTRKILVLIFVFILAVPTWAGFGIKGGSKAQNLAAGITWMQMLNNNWGLEAGAEYISSNPSVTNGFIYGKYVFTYLGRMPFGIKAGFDFYSSTGANSSAGWAGVEFGNLFDNSHMGLEFGTNLSGSNPISLQIFYLF